MTKFMYIIPALCLLITVESLFTNRSTARPSKHSKQKNSIRRVGYVPGGSNSFGSNGGYSDGVGRGSSNSQFSSSSPGAGGGYGRSGSNGASLQNGINGGRSNGYLNGLSNEYANGQADTANIGGGSSDSGDTFALFDSGAYGAPNFGSDSLGPGNPSSQLGNKNYANSPENTVDAGGAVGYGDQNGGFGNGNGHRHGNSGSGDSGDSLSEPANYEFSYEVHAPEYNVEFGHKESREGDEANGLYHVLLPDGRTQIVEYTADQDGYKPIISYQDSQGGNNNGAGNGTGGIGGGAGTSAGGAGGTNGFGNSGPGSFSSGLSGVGGYNDAFGNTGDHNQGFRGFSGFSPGGSANGRGNVGSSNSGFGEYSSGGNYGDQGDNNHGFPNGGYSRQSSYAGSNRYSNGGDQNGLGQNNGGSGLNGGGEGYSYGPGQNGAAKYTAFRSSQLNDAKSADSDLGGY